MENKVDVNAMNRDDFITCLQCTNNMFAIISLINLNTIYVAPSPPRPNSISNTLERQMAPKQMGHFSTSLQQSLPSSLCLHFSRS